MKKNKILIENILSLTVLQGINYLLPIITFPILVKKLGVEYFGVISVVSTIILYFQIASDYGFNLTATDLIAKNRRDHFQISKIFSTVISTKLLIVLFGAILLILFFLIFDTLDKYKYAILLNYGVIIGESLIPIWLFQGLQKMRFITTFTILSKAVFTVLIFLFINGPNDYLLVPSFYSLSALISGITAIIFSRYVLKISFIRPISSDILKSFKIGFNVFFSKVLVTSYSTSNILLLSVMTDPKTVGLYAISEKIIGAISGLFVPVSQAIFPLMSENFTKNRNVFFINFENIYKKFIIMGIVIISFVFVFNVKLIEFINGTYDFTIQYVLFFMVINLITSPLGSLFTQLYVITGYSKLFIKNVFITSLVNIISSIFLLKFFGVFGLATCVFITQFVHTFLNIFWYYKFVKS